MRKALIQSESLTPFQIRPKTNQASFLTPCFHYNATLRLGSAPDLANSIRRYLQ
jgi:hypothetical protein